MRLAVLATHPVQYFAPVFRGLASAPDLEVRVFFGSPHGARPALDPNFNAIFSWDSNPAEGFPVTFLSDTHLSGLSGLSGFFRGMMAALEIRNFKPDAVLVFGYLPSFISCATVFLRLCVSCLMLRAETTDVALNRGVIKAAVRASILRLFYSQFNYVFPIGINSAAHYKRMGVPEERQLIALYSIDVDYFDLQVKKWRPKRAKIRESLGIPDDAHVLLYCAKMSVPKNPTIIPEALAKLPPEMLSRVWLLAVGDGDLRGEFQELAEDVLPGKAIFVGFKNQSELGQYYSVADTLVLPSQSGETWGLVVNEAIQFGLGVLVSDKVGCAPDLVVPYSAGRVFRSGSAESLSLALLDALGSAGGARHNGVQLPHPRKFIDSILEVLERGGRITHAS